MTGSIKVIGVFCLLAGLGGCRPPDNTMPPQAVLEDTTALARRVDSTRLIDQDGLDHVPLHTGPYQKIPPELMQLLNRDYAGWVLPPLSAEALKQSARKTQGPYFVSTDFDRNGIKDYAVLLQVGDTTLVTAYLRETQGPPNKFILARQPLTVVFPQSSTSISLAGDSLAISTSQHTRVFAFTAGRFIPVDNSN